MSLPNRNEASIGEKFDELKLNRDSYTKMLERENSLNPNGMWNKEIADNLCTFIKRNKNLLHLDLSETNLTEYMIWTIGCSLSRAKSLVSIHFSGN